MSARKKKGVPFYRKGWFTAIAGIALIGAIGYAMHLVMKPEEAQRVREAADWFDEQAKS